jgi:hypothetical protein
MEKSDLLEKLKIINRDDIFCELYFYVNNIIKKTTLDKDLQKKLAFFYRDSVNIIFNEENDFRLDSIDNFNDEDAKVIYYFDNQNILDSIKILFEIKDDLETFNFKKDKLSNTNGIIIRLGLNKEENVVLYKKLSTIHLLQQAKTLMLISSNEQLDIIKQDILKLDNKFHFLNVDNKVFVINFNILEKSKSNIELLETIEFLEDLDKLKELSKNKTFAKKLHNINKSAVIDIMKDNPSKVETFINSHNELKDFFSIKNRKLYLKKQTKKNAEKLIKLLNDDLIHSELTEIMYETLNKAKLK